MRDFLDFGLYGILTDPLLGYEALAAVMTDCSVRYIQLRMKDRDDEEILRTAEKLRGVVRPPSLLIIDDRPDIAHKVGADGVHLGQSDTDCLSARRIMGEGAVIGLSTHNLDQTVKACAEHPAYIGVGPVYATPTKRIPDPVIGLRGMRGMIAAATCPAVAIGGIGLDNLRDVLEHGARNVCAVRCINQSESPRRVIEEMSRVIASYIQT